MSATTTPRRGAPAKNSPEGGCSTSRFGFWTPLDWRTITPVYKPGQSPAEIAERERIARERREAAERARAVRQLTASPSSASPAMPGSADDLTRDQRMALAKAYLRRVPPAIEGQAGDQHTFTQCCRAVRGFDLTESEAFDVLQEWDATCRPPWGGELRVKIVNAAKYANGQRGELLDKLLENSRRTGRNERPLNGSTHNDTGCSSLIRESALDGRLGGRTAAPWGDDIQATGGSGGLMDMVSGHRRRSSAARGGILSTLRAMNLSNWAAEMTVCRCKTASFRRVTHWHDANGEWRSREHGRACKHDFFCARCAWAEAVEWADGVRAMAESASYQWHARSLMVEASNFAAAVAAASKAASAIGTKKAAADFAAVVVISRSRSEFDADFDGRCVAVRIPVLVVYFAPPEADDAALRDRLDGVALPAGASWIEPTLMPVTVGQAAGAMQGAIEGVPHWLANLDATHQGREAFSGARLKRKNKLAQSLWREREKPEAEIIEDVFDLDAAVAAAPTEPTRIHAEAQTWLVTHEQFRRGWSPVKPVLIRHGNRVDLLHAHWIVHELSERLRAAALADSSGAGADTVAGDITPALCVWLARADDAIRRYAAVPAAESSGVGH